MDRHLRDLPPPLHPPWSVPSRRSALHPNEDSLHYHSSTEQHDLSSLSLATIIWDGTGIVCDLRRTPNTMPQNKKYDVAAGSKKRPLPRFLLPTRASSQVMRLNVEDKKRLQMKGRSEERRREARLEDRESERANRARKERATAFRSLSAVKVAWVAQFHLSLLPSFPRTFLYPKVVTTTT